MSWENSIACRFNRLYCKLKHQKNKQLTPKSHSNFFLTLLHQKYNLNEILTVVKLFTRAHDRIKNLKTEQVLIEIVRTNNGNNYFCLPEKTW